MGQESHIIRDSEGHPYEVLMLWDPQFLTASIKDGQFHVGYVSVSFNGEQATLGDIRIDDAVVIQTSYWRRLFKCVRLKDYRGRHLGTRALQLVIDQLKQMGKSTLIGKMGGTDDYERLACWYERLGFRVNLDTHEIALDLE